MDAVKRKIDDEEAIISDEETDFLGFDDGDQQNSENSFDRAKRAKRDSLAAGPAAHTEEEIIAMYQNWEEVDRSQLEETADAFKKPFQYGWKRELVFRATANPASKDRGEVYYYTPAGKKIRTRTDIQNNLDTSHMLTMDNFSFAKVPLYIGPGHEIIRSAKLKTTPVQSPREPPSLGKRIPKPKAPYVGDGPSPPQQVVPKAIGGKMSQPTTPLSQHQNPMKTKMDKVNRIMEKQMDALAKDLHRSNHSNFGGGGGGVGGGVKKGATMRFEDQSNMLRNAAIGYNVLQDIFQYLKVKELLRAGCVCRLFNQVANNSALWRTVRMKNSQVNDWEGFVRTLRKNGTRHLDLRKMLIPANSEAMWRSFTNHIGDLIRLESIDLCRCPGFVVEQICDSNQQLRVLNAPLIKDGEMVLDLKGIGRLNQLTELRLRPESWADLNGASLSGLAELKCLRRLSLTFFKFTADGSNVQALGQLTGLVSLELGDCSKISKTLCENVLPKLTQLERLRVEKCVDECNTIGMLQTISRMASLRQLELVNFDVKTHFDEELAKCSNIETLLIIPTYISQSATTNHMILNAVIKLASTLRTFTWVITTELLRVTELYVSSERPSSNDHRSHSNNNSHNGGNNNGDGGNEKESIPILKPVPGCAIATEDEADLSTDVQQVDIVSLSKVEHILTKFLPKTRSTIRKSNYTATWRLNIADNTATTATTTTAAASGNKC